MSKKPQVIPTQEQQDAAKEEMLAPKPTQDLIQAANETGADIAKEFEEKYPEAINQVPTKVQKLTEDMLAKSMAEKAKTEAGEQVVRPELAIEGAQVQGQVIPQGEQVIQEEDEVDPYTAVLTPEQIAERDEALRRRAGMTETVDNAIAAAAGNPPVTPPPSKPTTNDMEDNLPPKENKYENISQPQPNVAYDLIPLPSDGKVYPSKKKKLKIAYMTASDENILTNPNLLESGEFLEILFNRKILDQDIRYKDLHVGDRNAIMLWLRATAYGEIYPITLSDGKGERFDVDINLNEIKSIPLGAEPDSNGHFDFLLPQSKNQIKFKLLNMGEVDDIEAHVAYIKENVGSEYVDSVTYALEKQIVSVNGNNDMAYIKQFVQTMRLGDSRAFKKYVDEIESGVDLGISVRSPGGETINTFLPLSLRFFWPDL